VTGWLNETHVGDCRDLLKRMMADGVRVQTCVTSPPYYGLRDYGCEGQIGLEPTLVQYVAELVGVFRLVRSVLADDGTLSLNLGDSYSVQHIGRRDHGTRSPSSRLGPDRDGLPNSTEVQAGPNRSVAGLKPKDLLGVPWRVAFALQDDGWYLRSDVIWHKPNPMPESVIDRPTKSHEYLFLLAKSSRYYYDAAAIRREPDNGQDHPRSALHPPEPTGGLMSPHRGIRNPEGRNGRGRNKRSVWTVTTTPFRGGHFATFPRALIEPCILAGSRAGDIVLDPFMGSGTTAQVATDLGRNSIGCELNPPSTSSSMISGARPSECRCECNPKSQALDRHV
jgi:DNA modification methylase